MGKLKEIYEKQEAPLIKLREKIMGYRNRARELRLKYREMGDTKLADNYVGQEIALNLVLARINERLDRKVVGECNFNNCPKKATYESGLDQFCDEHLKIAKELLRLKLRSGKIVPIRWNKIKSV